MMARLYIDSLGDVRMYDHPLMECPMLFVAAFGAWLCETALPPSKAGHRMTEEEARRFLTDNPIPTHYKRGAA